MKVRLVCWNRPAAPGPEIDFAFTFDARGDWTPPVDRPFGYVEIPRQEQLAAIPRVGERVEGPDDMPLMWVHDVRWSFAHGFAFEPEVIVELTTRNPAS